MNDGYTKLFGSILTSTIWLEDHATFRVWIAILALKNADGEVAGTVPGLAHTARVTLEECEAALEKFLAPDKYSRTQENEGRRIQRIDGGWRVLNHDKYRDMLDAEDQRAKNAERQRRFRERNARNVTRNAESRESRHTDTDPDQESARPDLPGPELPDPRVPDRAQIGTGLTPTILTADLHRVADLDEKRRRLVRSAWNYAATKHGELKHGDGLSPTSPSWGLLPPADGPAAAALIERVAELLVQHEHDFPAVEDVLRRRVDVAAAIARRDRHLDWFIAMRMWDAKSFAIDAALSPEQVAAQKRRSPVARGTHSGDDEPRRIRKL